MSFKRRVVSGLQSFQKTSETSLTEEILDSGICPSPFNGVHITSSGCSSLDSITGLGGLPLGTCFLIEETGTTNFSDYLLRYFSAEGILHGHKIWSGGVSRAWFQTLPGEELNVVYHEKKNPDHVMKIAWRYNHLGDFENVTGLNRGPGIDKSESIPYCHTFDLTKHLKIPHTASITCSKVLHVPSKPYDEFISEILKLLSTKPLKTIRLVIPNILSPLIYPSESLKYKNILKFFHTLRALLRIYPNNLIAMISISTQLYVRESGIIRYLELLSDGVLELVPFSNTDSTDGFQGLLKSHKLPFSQNSFNRDNDLAFKVHRKRFLIEPWALPPVDEKESCTEDKTNTLISEIINFANNFQELSLGILSMHSDEDSSISDEINKLLNSEYENEKLIGTRKVIYLMSHGINMSEYFLSMIKNVASSNLEIQRLIYIYITRYSEYDPNLTLLSINTIQKGLNHKNPLFRGMSIKVLSGIRIPAISKIILLEIKRCIMDMSFYVRKCALISMVKCYRLDPSSLPTLIEYLSILFKDQSHIVFGSTFFVFQEICPERLDLIHPHYRRICRVLHELNEWDQTIVLNILLVYARKCFLMPQNTNYHDLNEEKFYSDEELNQNTSKSRDGALIDKDLDLLLTSVIPLLKSRNSSVVMAACKILYHVGPSTKYNELAKPLIWLLKKTPDIQYITLTNIAAISIKYPDIFSSFYKHFFIYPSDSERIWKLKLEILALIATKENVIDILKELWWYTKNSNSTIISGAIKSIGYCAINHSFISESCLQGLMANIDSANDILIEESVSVISQLIQLNPENCLHYIEQLVLRYDSIYIPSVRMSIIYLVSENIFNLPKLSLDMLRIAAKSFSQQEEIVKSQILVLAAKLYIIYNSDCFKKKSESSLDVFLKEFGVSDILDNNIFSNLLENKLSENDSIYNNSLNKSIVTKLCDYIMLLARYDSSFDLRDRTRVYKFLILDPTSLFSQKVIFSLKLDTKITYFENRETYTLGSSSLTLLRPVKGYKSLPDWIDNITQLPNSNLREEILNKNASYIDDDFPETISKITKKNSLVLSDLNTSIMQKLDDFYNSDTNSESIYTNLDNNTKNSYSEVDSDYEKSEDNKYKKIF
ncbi:hypothetical protein PORY_002582 [Pneumocystis oryctolagi]|uniref:Uncharacterized protein n=1 Tax=Pneumocystis oryctolagi TaxID=42067 RepID=A0ACB7C8P4_9ASCO|nr:hypothetical protein PORY_002582 [Pneumocystis oryctolagi]